jgi:hypothetical protein
MPSPFPGMDPYLEGHLWSNFHSDIISAAKRQLGPQLRPKYVAYTSKYFLFDTGGDIGISSPKIYPDVAVAHAVDSETVASGTATLQAPLVLEAFLPHEVPIPRLEIKDADSKRLVCVIEVLSPVNKRGEGRTQYLEKRNEILTSTAHLLEIDLLRRGTRIPIASPLPASSYYVFLSRVRRRSKVEVWPIGINASLPVVPVPLANGDPDIMLDLQAAFRDTYDSGNYDLAIDYAQEPDAGWTEEERKWGTQLLASRGLRNGK